MDINRLIEGFLGGSGGQAAKGAVGSAADTARRALSGGTGSGLAGGALAGGAVALLLGNKKARKLGGKALTYGGIAALGGLAYLAYRNYKSGQTSTPQSASTDLRSIPAPPPDSGFDPAATDARGGDLRLGLIQAMISAAKADGHIDAAEHGAISDQINALDLAPDEKAFLFDAMQAESDPLIIAGLAKNEAQSAELYLASILTIDPDTPEEQRYLDRLGDALRLPDALRTELARHAAAAKENVSAL